MKIFRTDHLTLPPLPAGHFFPIAKYSLLRQRVEEAAFVRPEWLIVPEPATEEEILRAHDPDYWARLRDGKLTPAEVRRIGLPWSPELVERVRYTTGGTIAACRAALEDGIAVNLAGGTHHAFRDAGEGYCLLNDSVIAARAVQAEGRVKRVVVIDCDSHQGNGTAVMARDDPTIFTFSIHAATAFPPRKETSDLDVALDRGTDDAVYLGMLEKGLREALDRADADFAIYLSGADPFEGDRIGHLALTKEGLAERDWMVLEALRERRIPVAVTMGGGYARRIEDTVDVYFQTVQLAFMEYMLLWPGCADA